MIVRCHEAVALALAGAALLLGCSGPEEPLDPPFPADYEATYTEVRDCRRSGDHDLNYIRILADPGSVEAYTGRALPFDEGAVILKEEFDFSDGTCEGDIVQWTVMVRLAEGSSPETLDWRWYQVDRDGLVVGEDTPRCYGCHLGCEGQGVGYLGTCAEP